VSESNFDAKVQSWTLNALVLLTLIPQLESDDEQRSRALLCSIMKINWPKIMVPVSRLKKTGNGAT